MKLISKQTALNLIEAANYKNEHDLHDMLRVVCKYHELIVGHGGLITDICKYHGKEIPKDRIWAGCDTDCPFLRMLELEKLEETESEDSE